MPLICHLHKTTSIEEGWEGWHRQGHGHLLGRLFCVPCEFGVAFFGRGTCTSELGPDVRGPERRVRPSPGLTSFLSPFLPPSSRSPSHPAAEIDEEDDEKDGSARMERIPSACR